MITIASSTPGKASSTSINRMITASTLLSGIAGQHAEGNADGRGDSCRQHAFHQRDARAIEDARQHVAAQLVGPEPVLQRRRRHHVRQVVVVGAVGCDQRRQQAGQHEDREQHQARQRHARAPELLPLGAPPRAARSAAFFFPRQWKWFGRCSLRGDPRIQQPVQQVGDDVHDDEGDGHHQHGGLHHREVARQDRLHQQPAQARARRTRFRSPPPSRAGSPAAGRPPSPPG